MYKNGVENQNKHHFFVDFFFDVQSVATESYGLIEFRFLRRRNPTLNTPTDIDRTSCTNKSSGERAINTHTLQYQYCDTSYVSRH